MLRVTRAGTTGRTRSLLVDCAALATSVLSSITSSSSDGDMLMLELDALLRVDVAGCAKTHSQ